MDGWITHTQPFSLHDGPGVRTTVFFAGCNLRCNWCHNPEAIYGRPRLQHLAAKCSGCGRCVSACPQGCLTRMPAMLDRSRCTGCGICVESCPFGALQLSCRRVGAEGLLEALLADRVFFEETGGGVTFSGGEPFLQPDFLHELAGRCKAAGIHTAVETAANVEDAVLLRTVPLLDLVICDLKAADNARHRQGTGVSNRLVLENLALLSQRAKRLWVRIPLVPGYNDTREELEAMAGILSPLPIEKVELLPYHALGAAKYESLGLDSEAHRYPMPAPGYTQGLQAQLLDRIAGLKLQ